MAQLARKHEEQQAGGGGMLGTSEEAQRWGEKTIKTTGGGGAGEGRGAAGGITPASGGEGRGGGGGVTTTTGVGEGRGAAAAGAADLTSLSPAGGGTTSTKTPTATTAATPSASNMSLAPFADAPAGVIRVLSALQGIISSRGMGEHCAVIGPAYATDVVIDTPFVLLSRKGELRVVCYTLFNSLFSGARFEPAFIEWGPAAPGTHALEAVGVMVFHPRRSLLVPPSLLLSRELRFRAVLTAGVRGGVDDGVIDFLRARLQNVPVPPVLLRSAVGGTVAKGLHATEPLWGQLAWLWGDNWWSERAERHRQQQQWQQQQQRVGMGGGGTYGYGGYGEEEERGARAAAAFRLQHHHHHAGVVGAAQDLTNAAIDYGSSLASRAAEYAGYLASSARHATTAAAAAVLPEGLVPGGGGDGVGGGHGTTAGGVGYGRGTDATTTAMGGGAGRDVAAKGADVAPKATGGGDATGKTAGGPSSYASAAAAAGPESRAARRRERTAAGAGD